jgi:hypothetical protein
VQVAGVTIIAASSRPIAIIAFCVFFIRIVPPEMSFHNLLQVSGTLFESPIY